MGAIIVKTYQQRKIEEVQKEAADNDLDFLFSDARTLFVDLDSEAAWKEFQTRYAELKSLLPIKNYRVRTSKSGLPHRHVYVDMNSSIDPYFRVLYQFALGSDSTREFLHLKELAIGIENPIVFFEKKGTN